MITRRCDLSRRLRTVMMSLLAGHLSMLVGACLAQANELVYSVSVPFPVEWASAAHTREVAQALQQLRTLFPEASVLHVGFDAQRSTPDDWKAVLDECQKAGYKVIVAFVNYDEQVGRIESIRPAVTQGRLPADNPFLRFLSTPACATHPALYAIFTLDEPWHHRKRPVYPPADLTAISTQLKQAASGADVKILVQFSRELWKELTKKRRGSGRAAPFWGRGFCDIVQISALEFQGEGYQRDMLEQNHYWSRKFIHDKTPDLELWTSVQVMGAKYGPPGNYWFPRERGGHRDLTTLLNAITDDKYESIHPLTGIMFQQWDSVAVQQRPRQYTLGDQDATGQELSQREAAADARQAIRDWIANR